MAKKQVKKAPQKAASKSSSKDSKALQSAGKQNGKKPVQVKGNKSNHSTSLKNGVGGLVKKATDQLSKKLGVKFSAKPQSKSGKSPNKPHKELASNKAKASKAHTVKKEMPVGAKAQKPKAAGDKVHGKSLRLSASSHEKAEKIERLEKAAKDKKEAEALKAKAAKAVPVAPVKLSKPVEKVSAKKGKGKEKPKKEELDLDDDSYVDDEGLGGSEIEEYEEELEAVESMDEEESDVLEYVAETMIDDSEVALTDAEGRRYCRSKDCDQIASVDSYCRYHYLLLWKNIQSRKKILQDGKLERYIEELTSRYPDKFVEMIRRDLRSEKDFLSAIQELEIDESSLENDMEEEAQSFIDEVRGMGEVTAAVDDDDF